MYYRITRWLVGNDYVPFKTSVQEAEIHPVSKFVIDNYEYIRSFFTIFPFIIPTMFLILVIYLTQRTFFYEMDYYYFYLKVKCYIN